MLCHPCSRPRHRRRCDPGSTLPATGSEAPAGDEAAPQVADLEELQAGVGERLVDVSDPLADARVSPLKRSAPLYLGIDLIQQRVYVPAVVRLNCALEGLHILLRHRPPVSRGPLGLPLSLQAAHLGGSPSASVVDCPPHPTRCVDWATKGQRTGRSPAEPPDERRSCYRAQSCAQTSSTEHAARSAKPKVHRFESCRARFRKPR